METVVTIVSILASLGGAVFYLDHKIAGVDHKVDGLRLELKSDFQRVETRLDGSIRSLDDRVFGLGSDMKPLIEQAQRSEAG